MLEDGYMGQAGPLSNVDIAVWLDPAMSPEQRFALRTELWLAAVEALGTGEVDIVVLNQAPPLLRHQVMKGGIRLFERDPRARVRLETAAVLEYFDTAARQRRALDILQFKLDILWQMNDAMALKYGVTA